MTDRPMVIVSSDCHIGPRLVEDLRPHCPKELLAQFDAFANASDRPHGRYVEQTGDDSGELAPWRNRWTAGHHDPVARRRDLDFEGVAAEVIFHGSQNDQPIPFQSSMLGTPEDPELAAAGIRIYNAWLAELCAAEPHRHVGLAHLPMWDVDAATEELRWAAGAGLKGANFPAPRPYLRPYNDRAWEPFWTAAEQAQIVRKAVNDLAPAYRSVLEARASSTEPEVAEQLGISLANVKVREKVLTDEQATAKARADAEQHLASIVAKEAQLDAAIRRAEEAAAKASGAAADAKTAAEATKPQG